MPEAPGFIVFPEQAGFFQIRQLQEKLLRFFQGTLTVTAALLDVPGLYRQEAQGKMMVDGPDRSREIAGLVAHHKIDR